MNTNPTNMFNSIQVGYHPDQEDSYPMKPIRNDKWTLKPNLNAFESTSPILNNIFQLPEPGVSLPTRVDKKLHLSDLNPSRIDTWKIKEFFQTNYFIFLSIEPTYHDMLYICASTVLL